VPEIIDFQGRTDQRKEKSSELKKSGEETISRHGKELKGKKKGARILWSHGDGAVDVGGGLGLGLWEAWRWFSQGGVI